MLAYTYNTFLSLSYVPEDAKKFVTAVSRKFNTREIHVKKFDTYIRTYTNNGTVLAVYSYKHNKGKMYA